MASIKLKENTCCSRKIKDNVGQGLMYIFVYMNALILSEVTMIKRKSVLEGNHTLGCLDYREQHCHFQQM